MQKSLLLAFIVILASCHKEKPVQKLKQGTYKGILKVQDNEDLPFIFEVENEHSLKIFNADEVIVVDEIKYKKDSVFIKLPYFETYIAAKIEGDNFHGQLIEEDRNRSVAFKTEFGEVNRFNSQNIDFNTDVSGVWEFEFNDYGRIYPAKGEFKQNENIVTGTFRTPSGDYRFLEGIVEGDIIKVSTFDGAHAFLFKAHVTDTTMVGDFYSGNHSKETFTGKRNKNFELPDEYTLTFIKEGYNTFNFSFPDLEGNIVSLSDNRFKDKVVLIQLMGSYCPNCLDETKFYSKFHEANKDRGLEIVALAFENAKTKEKAISAINRMKNKVGLNYPILLAQVGTNDKAKAREKLPMLNHVLSYPTTVFIDKKGMVRKIHTGFNGPATGQKYLDFQEEFNNFVNTLLNE